MFDIDIVIDKCDSIVSSGFIRPSVSLYVQKLITTSKFLKEVLDILCFYTMSFHVGTFLDESVVTNANII
jgi:hypothetical protein